ncbi:Parg protein [Dirofilaria immitis]|nr:Parg protein [Dirofilaria immitis]
MLKLLKSMSRQEVSYADYQSYEGMNIEMSGCFHDNESMNDEHIEIEDCVVGEDDMCIVGSLCPKTVLKRQTTLDAFFPSEPNRKSRKSFGSVVEEVDRGGNGERSHYDWARMKAGKITLDKYVEVGPHSTYSDTSRKLAIDSIRCYDDMYPDLSSRNISDVVLVSVNSLSSETSPKPYPIICTDPTYGWNFGKKYVRLPYSICNMINGTARYEIIQNAISKLLKPLMTYKQIKECIRSYSRVTSFDALRQLFETVLDETLRMEYLTTVVPFMAKLALQSPSLITQPIPILRRGSSGSITISQHQAASLLALAFFALFQVVMLSTTIYRQLILPFVQFALCKCGRKIAMFNALFPYVPTGLLTIRRQNGSAQNWSSMHLPLSELYVSHTGTIEDDGHGMLQVDFANEYIGGGVLSSGCVQEEIRFLICPEMIVSMILCERMHHNEAIVISGAERFSDYDGYGSSFRWRPMEKMNSFPRDRFRRLCSELVAIDALPFANRHEQFNIDVIDRELLKAYVGFAVNNETMKPVATGNWGCGVFGGDLHLKSLIQLMASSAQKRCLCYFTFGNRKFAEDFEEIYKVLTQAGITVGQLYDLINSYCSEYNENSSLLFEYISWKIKESTTCP